MNYIYARKINVRTHVKISRKWKSTLTYQLQYLQLLLGTGEYCLLQSLFLLRLISIDALVSYVRLRATFHTLSLFYLRT